MLIAALRAKFRLDEKLNFIAQLGRIWRMDLVYRSAAKRSLNLRLARAAEYVLMRLALVIKYVSARLVWFSIHASDEILQLAFVSRKTAAQDALFSACVLGLIFYPASSQSRAHLPMLR